MAAELRRAALALLIASPLAAGAADAAIARIAAANGSVLVSRDATIASARESQRLLPGTRVLTTARATAVIEYDDGCRVTVAPGERFEVAARTPCAAAARIPTPAARPLVAGIR